MGIKGRHAIFKGSAPLFIGATKTIDFTHPCGATRKGYALIVFSEVSIHAPARGATGAELSFF